MKSKKANSAYVANKGLVLSGPSFDNQPEEAPKDLQVEYSPGVLEEIARFAYDGFLRASRGGIEVGGLLFGRCERNTVHVQAWRPAPCEHVAGPQFSLSKRDETALAEVLGRSASDHLLRSMQPVGWFQSMMGRQLRPKQESMGLFDRALGDRWLTALVLGRGNGNRLRSAFFVRHAGGAISMADFAKEIEVRPLPVRAGAIGYQEEEPNKVNVPKLAWVLIAACVALSALVGWSMWDFVRTPPSVQAASILKLSERHDQMEITWDSHLAAIRAAERGELSISDGSHLEKRDLSNPELRAGIAAYARQSEDVQVRLVVYAAKPGSQPMQLQARFVGPLNSYSQLQEARRQIEELNHKISKMDEEMKTEKSRNRQLTKELRADTQ